MPAKKEVVKYMDLFFGAFCLKNRSKSVAFKDLFKYLAIYLPLLNDSLIVEQCIFAFCF
jgi:hypothetical protein